MQYQRPVYKFDTSKENNFLYNPNKKITRFYQICIFKNKKSDKYHIRRYIIDENNNLFDIKENKLNDKQYSKLFTLRKPHEYKLYSTYTLEDIEHVNVSDILLANSDILSNNYDYSGFAPWK